jgi:multiple sugar transport system permease protein
MHRKGIYTRRQKEEQAGYLFILPTYVSYFVFMLIPLGITIWYSFTEYNALKPPVFIGLQNYIKLFSDQIAWETLYNTVLFTIGTTACKTILGIILALIFNSKVLLPLIRNIARGCVFLPYIIGLSYIALIWSFMFATDTGIVNWYLNRIGLDSVPWFVNPHLAMAMLIILDIWKNAGYAMIIMLAGLQSIPNEYYEAASIDGASSLQRVWRISLPLLRPMIIMSVILFTISGLQFFDSASVLTKGGPGNATRSFIMHIYDTAFSNFSLGYASMLSLVFMFIILAFTVFQLKYDTDVSA